MGEEQQEGVGGRFFTVEQLGHLSSPPPDQLPPIPSLLLKKTSKTSDYPPGPKFGYSESYQKLLDLIVSWTLTMPI